MARDKTIQAKHISEQEIIAACNMYHAGLAETPERALAHKYPSNVILHKMRKMNDRGILDYGVSLRTSWVVDY